MGYRLSRETSPFPATKIPALLSLVCVLICMWSCSGGPSPPSDDTSLAGPMLSDVEPVALHDDLPQMRAAGELRVLIHRQDASALGLPGSTADREMALVGLFARELGLPVRFVVVDRDDKLIPSLLEGRGDLIADALTATPERADKVLMSTPIRYVDEVVVVRQGASDVPRTAAELFASDQAAAMRLHLKASSAFVSTLSQQAAKARASLDFEPLPEELLQYQILDRVSAGIIPLTVQDSDAVATYLERTGEEVAESAFDASETEADEFRGIEVAFVLAKGRPVSWAARPSSARLIDAVNAFVFELDPDARSDEIYGGDLDDIRKRGILRVALPNNSSSYFIYRGQPVGFQYELARELARRLKVRLRPVAVRGRSSEAVQLLADGRVDLVAPFLTITPERERDLRFTRPLFKVDEVLVQRSGAPPVERIAELAGRSVTVDPDTSYWRTLEALRQKVALKLVTADDDLVLEDLFEKVALGEVELTVADSHRLQRWLTFNEGVQRSAVLAEGKPIAFATGFDRPQLWEAVDAFVADVADGPLFQRLYRSYFEDERRIRREQPVVAKSGQISPYDDLIRKYSRRYGFDWRFIAAQMYQESGFNPKARSFAGARGLLQVMPATARELGYDPNDLYDPETGIAAGVDYMHRMVQRFPPDLPLERRLHFALASYNAGYGHVIDARTLARAINKNRNIWMVNVEESIVLLEDPAYHSQARHGYCRGSEPRTYVRNISQYYEVFSAAAAAADR